MPSPSHGADRVGNLVLRHASPPEGDAPYRRRPEGPLEIERQRAHVPRTRPGLISALVAVLGLVLLVFAAYVRSGPAIGAVSFALVALAWLVLRSRGSVDRLERVRVDEDRLRLEGVEEPLTAPVADVERIDIGLDAASLRTVFASIANRGRVMLLDGLTELEADAMAAALRDALGHAAPAASAPRARVEVDEPPPTDPVPARELTDDERARIESLGRDYGSHR